MLKRYSQREWIGGLLRQRVNSSSNSALISCRVFASPILFLLNGLIVCENFWLLVQALPQTEHLPDLLPYNLTSSKMGIGLFFCVEKYANNPAPPAQPRYASRPA